MKLISVVIAAVLMTGAAWGQETDNRVAQSLALSAQAAMIQNQYPEAAMALTARAAQVLTAPPMPEVALFVDGRLVNGCKDGFLELCDILIETPGHIHARHIAEFLHASCAGDNADDLKACAISEAISAELDKQ